MKNLFDRLIPQTSALRLAYHRAKTDVAALCYGFPARKLTVIGITGTDGKTTTVGMTAHILNACGKKTGALSTAFFQIGNEITWNKTQKTSPSPFMIQKFLRRLVSEGCTHAVLECSSHGLLQGRLNHTQPRIAGITNIAEEHLDYHGSMQAYVNSKAILFRMLRKNSGVAVLNASDRSFDSLRTVPVPWRIIFGEKESVVSLNSSDDLGLWASDIAGNGNGLSATIHCNADEGPWQLTLPMNGAFNVQNALCANSCAHAAGIRIGDCVKALASFRGVPGRMERIEAGQHFGVFVDFTVTPQSYEATLSTMRSSLKPGARLLVLMGSCGDRMKEKRPKIGRIAASLGDIVVVTNEDPYTEDPDRIIDDVLSGVPSDIPVLRDSSSVEHHHYFLRINDRLQAVRTILSLAKPDDVVIFCGKGSDTTMMTSKGQIPWNEREIVRKELESLAAKAE